LHLPDIDPYSLTVKVDAFNPTEVTRDSLQGFVEGEGVVSIEPEHFTKKTGPGSRRQNQAVTP
jgi:hypothetical protein